MRFNMLNLKHLSCSLPGDQGDLACRFEDCSTSIQQMIHCIEAVEAQLREKRQAIEEIRARHEVLAGELALTVGDLGGVLSAHRMLSDVEQSSNGQVEKKVLKLRASGMGIKRIAKEAGVGVGTVYRILGKAA